MAVKCGGGCALTMLGKTVICLYLIFNYDGKSILGDKRAMQQDWNG